MEELNRDHVFSVQVTDYRLMTRSQARTYLDDVLYAAFERAKEVIMMINDEEED